ncbi:DUF2191 domain-containing protein [Stackebrandtia soli]|uniref:DUF2191 domain-containing protein n=1 Tax=Stackebrandtia soli TaxID=1892856 RepID=UPI0039EADCC9
MTRITVDVNDEWLTAAQQELGTTTKVATINSALQCVAARHMAKVAIDVLDRVSMDFSRPIDPFAYDGGRDLSRLEADARGNDEERY